MAKPKSVSKPLQAFVAWMPFGASLVSTFGFWLNQDTTQTAIAGFATGLSVLWAKYSGGFMAEAEQEMEKLGRASARGLFKVFYFFLSLIGTVFDALRKWAAQHWWEITSDFEGKYYELGMTCPKARGGTSRVCCGVRRFFLLSRIASRLVNCST